MDEDRDGRLRRQDASQFGPAGGVGEDGRRTGRHGLIGELRAVRAGPGQSGEQVTGPDVLRPQDDPGHLGLGVGAADQVESGPGGGGQHGHRCRRDMTRTDGSATPVG